MLANCECSSTAPDLLYLMELDTVRVLAMLVEWNRLLLDGNSIENHGLE